LPVSKETTWERTIGSGAREVPLLILSGPRFRLLSQHPLLQSGSASSSTPTLEGLARDTMKDFQELMDEAVRDLLKKHHRPVTVKEMLRQSARNAPAND
jgi:hypothetical protein